MMGLVVVRNCKWRRMYLRKCERAVYEKKQMLQQRWQPQVEVVEGFLRRNPCWKDSLKCLISHNNTNTTEVGNWNIISIIINGNQKQKNCIKFGETKHVVYSLEFIQENQAAKLYD